MQGMLGHLRAYLGNLQQRGEISVFVGQPGNLIGWGLVQCLKILMSLNRTQAIPVSEKNLVWCVEKDKKGVRQTNRLWFQVVFLLLTGQQFVKGMMI